MSVRMAKEQDLPVNPMRIAGACGRLMCCLKYEHPLYQDFRKDAPRIGEAVETPEGPGTVTGHNVPATRWWSSCTPMAPPTPARGPACAAHARPTRRRTVRKTIRINRPGMVPG